VDDLTELLVNELLEQRMHLRQGRQSRCVGHEDLHTVGLAPRQDVQPGVVVDTDQLGVQRSGHAACASATAFGLISINRATSSGRTLPRKTCM
jgi:hypothetical protein